MKATRLLALVLALLMVAAFALTACTDKTGDDTTAAPGTEPGTEAPTTQQPPLQEGYVEVPKPTYQNSSDPASGKVVMGSSTDLQGDFRRPSFASPSPAASDLDVYNLTVGYGTMETNKEGIYVWNQTAVKSYEIKTNDDGSKTFTIEIRSGLKYSDGSEVTAKDYLATILVFSTEIATAAGSDSATAGLNFLGYEAFNKYLGEEAEGTSRVFTGVRLLDTYKFALTIDPEYIPYYYEEVYAAVDPIPYKVWLGDAADIKDDGNGAYLTDAFYAKNDAGDYAIVDTIQAGRTDVTNYPFSGPYVVSEYDASTLQATLTVNPNYAGNYEGRLPKVETIVYTKVVSETQMDQLSSGLVDVLCDLTSGDDIKAAIALAEGDGYSQQSYMRAGYGKIQFICDFGPTMYTSTRQAISYLLNKQEFADTFCQGYGAVVYGPYSVDSWMYKMTEDDILAGVNEYAYSVANAKKVLREDGWVYNADGSDYDEEAGGVRYRKLTAEEAANEDNINYVSVENTDGIEYKTVKVGDDYYMPLVINYISTENNQVSEMLKVRLTDSAAVTDAGMVIRQVVGTFADLLSAVYHQSTIYGMANLATGFTSTIYDQSYYFTVDDALFYAYSNNYLKDPLDLAYRYDDHKDATYEEDVANVENLGLDYLSMAMVYRATTEEEYAFYFKYFILRWNAMVPEIPLYCNMYYTIFNSKIQGLEGDNALNPYWGFAKAVLYCTVA